MICVIQQKPDQGGVSTTFISQQETYKACWANVGGRSEQPGPINQTLSLTARVHVITTQQDKQYHCPICKTWQEKHQGEEPKWADVNPLLKKIVKHNSLRSKHEDLFVISWLMKSIHVKLCLPLGGKKLSWNRDLHIREEHRVLQ